jgi:hypothetical protein
MKIPLRDSTLEASLPAVNSVGRISGRTTLRSRQTKSVSAKVVSQWSVIVVDSKPFRQKVQRDYGRAVRELDAARTEAERFQQEDKPLFERWINASFGKQLTELRDIQGQLFEAQHLVNEVQQEYHYGNHASIIAAYKAVMDRRAHPEEYETDDSEPSSDEAHHDNQESNGAFDGDFSESYIPRANAGAPKSSRLKELYRKLARRLHPDNQREITAREKELWHKTQAAYDEGSVEVLETILATLEVDEKGAKNANISTLMQLTESLKQRLRSLRRELSKFRRDIAWDFSRNSERGELIRKVEESIHSDHHKLHWLLTKYRAQIERWELQARVQGKRVRARRTNWMDEELI